MVQQGKPDELYDMFAVSSQRTFPAHPFPRNYLHCILDDLDLAVQAVHALRADGFQTSDIHLMASWDFIEAIEGRRQPKGRFAKTLRQVLTDDGLYDLYLCEAQHGRHVLSVRLTKHRHLEQVRRLLTPLGAHLMKYVTTWIKADLLP